MQRFGVSINGGPRFVVTAASPQQAAEFGMGIVCPTPDATDAVDVSVEGRDGISLWQVAPLNSLSWGAFPGAAPRSTGSTQSKGLRVLKELLDIGSLIYGALSAGCEAPQSVQN